MFVLIPKVFDTNQNLLSIKFYGFVKSAFKNSNKLEQI